MKTLKLLVVALITLSLISGCNSLKKSTKTVDDTSTGLQQTGSSKLSVGSVDTSKSLQRVEEHSDESEVEITFWPGEPDESEFLGVPDSVVDTRVDQATWPLSQKANDYAGATAIQPKTPRIVVPKAGFRTYNINGNIIQTPAAIKEIKLKNKLTGSVTAIDIIKGLSRDSTANRDTASTAITHSVRATESSKQRFQIPFLAYIFTFVALVGIIWFLIVRFKRKKAQKLLQTLKDKL